MVSDIGNQTIAEGESFVTINLDDYVEDPDTPDENIAWSATGQVELSVSIVSRVATITAPSSDWNGSETVTFTANDGESEDSDDAVFTVNAVNDAPVVSDIGNQTIAEGGSFSTINLDDYVSDVETPDASIIWSYSGNSDLLIDITNRIATITTPGSDWNGSEAVSYTHLTLPTNREV